AKVAEAHVRRAMHVPARPAVPEDQPARTAPSATLDYYVASHNDALQLLSAAVAAGGAGAATTSVYCRREADRATLREELDLRGLTADVHVYGDNTRTAERSIGYGVPFDLDALNGAFSAGGTIIIDPRELSHLRDMARQANLALRAAPVTVGAAGGIERFLETIRRAIQEEDIEAQLLVIGPLLQEHSAAEVAAAASALLRKRAPAPAAAAISPPASAMASAFVKLFVSVGQRDGIAPREIVGAITGEAGVKGDQIGRVDIRDTFSIVEVAADAAERVIRALNGTSLRGRSVRVDFDRRTGGARRALPARRARPAQ
ncbi:MAG TPA: DbpA RNA binding domain-containing protein, partial [Longimicrobiales bacterium]|nr:DbpA RNA binding domain-containing protein [Longimicrobiales bacterium]